MTDRHEQLLDRISKYKAAEKMTKQMINCAAFKEGDRVTISTHGDNQGTVQELSLIRPTYVVVQMDGEPGPRCCLPENVRKIET